MTELEKTIFLNLIQNGYGVGRACRTMNMSFKKIRQIIEDNKIFKTEIENAMLVGLADLVTKLTSAKTLGAKKEYTEAINQFVTRIPEFRHYRYFELLNIKTEMLSGYNLEDIAIRYGFEYMNLLNRISENSLLKQEILEPIYMHKSKVSPVK